MRAVLLGAVLVLGVASFVLADDSTGQPSARKGYQEAEGDYFRAVMVHHNTKLEITATEKRIRDAEARLGPLHAVVAYLKSTCAPGDPQIAEAQKRVYARTMELKIGENIVLLDQLMKKELETRETVIQSGTVALDAMLRYIERMGQIQGPGREEQVAPVRSKSLELMNQLDLLERQGSPTVTTFKPLGPDPATPKGCGDLVRIYDEDRRTTLDLGQSLRQRALAKRVQHDRLDKLKWDESGVIVKRVSERIKTLSDQIDEIDAACAAATQRASDLANEIARLERLKVQLEGNIWKKSGDKDGGKK